MAENDQHLKHGKALCGKVFGRFVETFNALVDFMLGIKGDADGKNGEGHITYDRKNNIIRCDGCGGKGGSGSGVTAAEGSGLAVTDGEIDLSGRSDDDTFGIRTLTVGSGEDAKTLKVLGTDPKSAGDPEEENDDSGHPSDNPSGEDPDPSDIDTPGDDPDFDPDEDIPEGGVPACDDAGGVPVGESGGEQPGGVPADGDTHSGDGCTAC